MLELLVEKVSDLADNPISTPMLRGGVGVASRIILMIQQHRARWSCWSRHSSQSRLTRPSKRASWIPTSRERRKQRSLRWSLGYRPYLQYRRIPIFHPIDSGMKEMIDWFYSFLRKSKILHISQSSHSRENAFPGNSCSDRASLSKVNGWIRKR